MYLCGFSLDNLSLMALAIASGFVVDDAIVVMENITRHLEAGMTPMEATLLGAQEIGFTVFSISVSLIAVFIPLLADGRHYRASLPRIRHYSLQRHSGLDGHLAHHHAHDVLARSGLGESEIKHGRLYDWSEARLQLRARRYTAAASPGCSITPRRC